ncbi:Glycosyl hydrolases 36 [Dillenia turbinata]|uniref:Glycosyl hydrolases 36 n=1 Tax=Dillenia turbinata TaxID=194707 RepID=A0AAN8ZVX2_9MAGN
MTVGAGINVSDGKLMVLGKCILNDVHDNIVVTPATGDAVTNGGFIGVVPDRIGSRRVFPVGKLEGLRFMCVFRFKLWWMTQRMGSCGQDIPFEIQFLIVELNDGSEFGDEGDFRAVLQGNDNNELVICLESGDPDAEGFEGSHLVFVAAGADPFQVIANAVNFANRLTNIRENHKFQKDGQEGHIVEDPALGLAHIVWNLNDYTGVMGVFNCQEAGWSRVEKKNLIDDEQPGTITGVVRSKDFEYLSEVVDDSWNGDAIVYSHLGDHLSPKECIIACYSKIKRIQSFTVVPVRKLSNEVAFAPIGLIKMFNSGGAIRELKYEPDGTANVIMKTRGSGVFGAYSSGRPRRSMLRKSSLDTKKGPDWSPSHYKSQRKSFICGVLP